ncbi:MAG: hypothetical protein DIKNOCCD_02938 [bacterium]|nr:hypothetical protein [bacterium]
MLAVDDDRTHSSISGSGHEDLLFPETDREVLFDRMDCIRDVGNEDELICLVNVFKQPPHQSSGRPERIITEVDRLLGLIDITAEFCQRVIHSEMVCKGQKMLHGFPAVFISAGSRVSQNHPCFTGGPVTPIDPGPEFPQPGWLFIHVIIGWIVWKDERIRAKPGDGFNLSQYPFR